MDYWQQNNIWFLVQNINLGSSLLDIISNIFLLILNIRGRPKCTIQKTTQEIPHSAMICINNCYSASKIIKGEVVTEISSFISRHIFAKLAEFYFHTYSFFSKNRTNLISLCFEKEFLMTFILKRNAIVTWILSWYQNSANRQN